LPQRGDVLDLSDASGVTDYVYCTDVSIDQVESAAGDESQDFLFEVVATYKSLNGRNPTPVVDKATWGISFQPQKITIANVEKDSDQTHYAPGSGSEEWPEVTTGINENQDGPAGTQIDEMVEVLSIDFWKDPADIEDFLAAIRGIVNTTNDADFEGPWGTYAAGEAKITGLQVGQQNPEIVTVSVSISRSLNRDAIQIQLDTAATPVSVDKKGWEFLWVRWLKSVDPGDANENPKPRRIDAHVATVYPEGDFDALGITPSLWT